jgi:hypothetical protein
LIISGRGAPAAYKEYRFVREREFVVLKILNIYLPLWRKEQKVQEMAGLEFGKLASASLRARDTQRLFLVVVEVRGVARAWKFLG